MKNQSLTLFLLLLATNCFAQNEGESSATIGIKFTGVPIISITGTDTTYRNGMSISPGIELRDKKGWGIAYSPSIISSNQQTNIFMHTLTVGYEKYGGKNFDLAFNYTHYFFTNNTSVPYSPISNELYLSFSYAKTWLKPVVSASAGFGKDSNNVWAHDVSFAAGLTHGFSWKDSGPFSTIEVNPSTILNGATNGYFSFLQTSGYLSHNGHYAKVVKKHHKNNTSQTTFALSNVECSVDGNLEIGSFSIRPLGSLVFPLGHAGEPGIFAYGEISLQFSF